MKAAYILAPITLAIGAFAGPVAEPNSPPPKPVSTCSSTQKVSCCNNAAGLTLVQGVLCNLAVLGQNCNAGDTFCCPVNQAGLINVGAPCIKLDL